MAFDQAFAGIAALRDAGRYDEALAALREAARTYPADKAAHHELGLLLMQLGRLDEAEQAFRRALAIDPAIPQTRHALGITFLALGRYAEGWPLYQARFDVAEFNIRLPAGFPFPRWSGEELAGRRIVVFPEQGYGDQIQFARFIPLLRDRGAEVVLLARPALAALFAASFPGVTVLPATGSVDFPDPDFWAMSSDLAWLVGATPANLPPPPYLVADAPSDPAGVRIGVMTRGNPAFRNDAHRSLPATDAARLRAALGEALVDLDPEVTGAADFAATAAIVAGLDAVVSVDTAVAHLAGALGKPCFTLLQGFATDWRWMRDRADTPWYPTMRLYRAAIGGDWRPATDALLADLRALVRPKEIALHGESAVRARDLMQRSIEHHAAGRGMEAAKLARQAVAARPDHAGAHYNLGITLHRIGRPEEAESAFRRSLALQPATPEVSTSLAQALLAQGKYSEGWRLFAARAETTWLRDTFANNRPAPRWNGEDLAGKRVIVVPEQGLGDAIQLARFLPLLAGRAAALRVLVHAPLLRLFRHSFPALDIRDAESATDLTGADLWLTPFDLPALFGATLEALPQPPYLAAPSPTSPRPPGFRIGLVTRGNPEHVNDRWRSLPEPLADELRTRLPGTIVPLEPEATGARDFADTAAIIDRLDLVVSIDSAAAHLAGAMGKPVLLLLSGFATDWRWLYDRDDSPWYPGHTLFRGEPDGGRGDVIDRVIAEAGRRAHQASAR